MIFNQKMKAILAFLVFICPALVHADPVWIDVRSQAEYEIDHIEGDRLIAHTDILKKVSELYPNHETEIHLYCRSGNRAGIAKSILNKAGYKNVYNEGSIGATREVRNLLEKKK